MNYFLKDGRVFAFKQDDLVPDGMAGITEAKMLELTAPPPPPPPVPHLGREDFCVALMGVGVFTKTEAASAAIGNWPSKFEPAIAGMPFVDGLKARNAWRMTNLVYRDSPLFLALLAFFARAQGLSDDAARALGDKIFEGASNG